MLDREGAELKEKQKLEALAKAIGLVWHSDPQGRNLRPADWAAYTGRAIDGPEDDSWLQDIHEDDVERVLKTVHAATRNGTDYETKYRIRRHDGEWRWHLARGVPLIETQDRETEFIGVCIDIHDSVVAQSAVHLMHEKLFQATRTNSMISLSSAIAHEINQPLAAAVNAIAAATIRLADGADKEKVSTSLKEALDSVMLAGDVIRKLRELVERRTSEPKTLSLGEVVDSLKPITSGMMADILEKTIGSNGDEIYFNEVQLKQVLLNLFRNSIDAIADSSQPAIRIESRAINPDFVMVSVHDSGPGVPEKLKQRLFQPFASGEDSGGLGIGLSICRNIVEQNGGKIWLEQSEGSGAIVCFTAPRRKL